MLLCPWDSLGKNTGVGCYFLLQGIFQAQGLNLCLLHCRWVFLPLSHLGIPFKVLNIHTVKFIFCATYNINIFTFCLAFFFNLAINIWLNIRP